MRAIVAAGTDIGHVREGNEDSFLVLDPLWVVADGMGGHLGGEVASRLAVETIERLTQRSEGSLAERILEANRVVFERSVLDRSVSGMGTTLTAALLEGDRLHLAHVGDSRAYLFRGGELRQLTEDHTLVARMVQDGELTLAEAEQHPYRSILTRTIGVEPNVAVDESDVPLEAGDRVLLCSDGLTGMLPDDRIADVLAAEPDPNAAVRRLIAGANDAGGVDNITAVLIDLLEGDAHDAAQAMAPGTRAGTPAMDPGTRAATPSGDPGRGAERASVEEHEPIAERRGMPGAGSGASRPRRDAGRRALVWGGVSLGILVLAFVGFRIYLDAQWYVGVSDGRVAVFRGIPAEVAGFELHQVVLETTIPAGDAEALALYRDLEDGITTDSREEADAIVEQIRLDVAAAGGGASP